MMAGDGRAVRSSERLGSQGLLVLELTGFFLQLPRMNVLNPNNESVPEIESEKLKGKVREFWNRQACDTHMAGAAKFTRDYFEQIESFRYRDQPCIHAFAQFTRYHGRKTLEVGVGAGTDFIQWLRAGAIASGIDLTQEAIDHVANRVSVYGLPGAETLQVGDAENLPFASETFDLGY